MSRDDSASGDLQTLTERIRAAKEAHEAELMAKAHVVGVGIGIRQRDGKYTDEPVLVVLVNRKMPLDQVAPQDLIPPTLDGVPVDVQQVGDLKAQNS